MTTRSPKSTAKLDNAAKIKRLAGRGFSLEDIAIACNISKGGLEYWLKDEAIRELWQQGKNEAIDKVAANLFKIATDSKHPQQLTACIFYLKCQAGWREKDRLEDVKPAIDNVQIYIPDNKRGNNGTVEPIRLEASTT
jgi:hypothetical protein